MLLGVDSLDSTRGLVHKFLAVEEMFEMEPGLADRVAFVQVSLVLDKVTRYHEDNDDNFFVKNSGRRRSRSGWSSSGGSSGGGGSGGGSSSSRSGSTISCARDIVIRTCDEHKKT